jgi:hypothetical protein
MYFIRNAQNLIFISVYSRNFITIFKLRRKFRNKLLIHSHFLPGIKADFLTRKHYCVNKHSLHKQWIHITKRQLPVYTLHFRHFLLKVTK